MFGSVDLKQELFKVRLKTRQEDLLVSDAKKILKEDLFSNKKVLQNLSEYRGSDKTLNEESLDPDYLFSPAEIKVLSIKYRLKFLENKFFKPEIPQDVKLKMKALNDKFYKEISDFTVLGVPGSFENSDTISSACFFAKTNHDNYYLLDVWGKPLKQIRSVLFWPLRKFENLILSVILFTLVLTLILPTRLITLDHSATYWSGYRAAAFFHLLIFNSGVTVYFTFAFAKNFSSTIWNRYRDF